MDFEKKSRANTLNTLMFKIDEREMYENMQAFFIYYNGCQNISFSLAKNYNYKCIFKIMPES